MEIRPIKTEADFEATLKEIEGLMSAEADSPEGDRLDVLVTLVEAYECKSTIQWISLIQWRPSSSGWNSRALP